MTWTLMATRCHCGQICQKCELLIEGLTLARIAALLGPKKPVAMD
jgi:hypothetical protein